MTPPRRTPSSYALVPEHFGKPALHGWKKVTGRKQVAAARAARLQHNVALTVRAYLEDHGLHQYDVRDELGDGWGEGKVSRLLGGEATMSLADMFTLIDMCGLSLAEFAGAQAGDDLPAASRNAVIADFLQDQLEKLREESVRNAPARPST